MKQILIVDDAATVRLYHRNLLEGAGYAVAEAVNGVEALEKAFTDAFDMYLVDVNMPMLDGYGFLQQLRAQDMPQAPAIMITTEAGEHDCQHAYECGANLYIVKPTRPEPFLQAVKILLGDRN